MPEKVIQNPVTLLIYWPYFMENIQYSSVSDSTHLVEEYVIGIFDVFSILDCEQKKKESQSPVNKTKFLK